MIEAAFKDAMAKARLATDDAIIADGRLHRFDVKGDKRRSLTGWYVLHGDGIAAGAFGCWRRDIKENWCARSWRCMSSDERREYQRKIERARVIREADEKARQEAAARIAERLWREALPASPSHPYFTKKKVKNHGLRLAANNKLLVPLADSSGVLYSLQFINADGQKRFLLNGRVRGCYFTIGKIQGTLCICEGYATGASIHEATGYATVCALCATNLPIVAETLRRRCPGAKIIICADDDANTSGNPGLKYAQIAAKAVNGYLAVAGGHT